MIMTQGGPQNATMTPIYYIYRTGFTDRQLLKFLKAGQFLISQADIRNPRSLLAHNQIAATQLIRRGLPPPDTSKSPPLFIAFCN